MMNMMMMYQMFLLSILVIVQKYVFDDDIDIDMVDEYDYRMNEMIILKNRG